MALTIISTPFRSLSKVIPSPKHMNEMVIEGCLRRCVEVCKSKALQTRTRCQQTLDGTTPSKDLHVKNIFRLFYLVNFIQHNICICKESPLLP